jgi:hypothetical protein
VQVKRLESEVVAQSMVVEALAAERDACRAAVSEANQRTTVRRRAGPYPLQRPPHLAPNQ